MGAINVTLPLAVLRTEDYLIHSFLGVRGFHQLWNVGFCAASYQCWDLWQSSDRLAGDKQTFDTSKLYHGLVLLALERTDLLKFQMDYTSSSYSWFDKISSTFNIRANGFILIDSKTGLCLDVRGVAQKEDAARLYIISKEALDESCNGVVEFRKSRILLRREPNCLIGLYTEEMPSS